MSRPKPVRTPRHLYPSVAALAAVLRVSDVAVTRYCLDCGTHYELRPLCPRAYAVWHAQHGYYDEDVADTEPATIL